MYAQSIRAVLALFRTQELVAKKIRQWQLPGSLFSRSISRIDQLNAKQRFLRLFAGKIASVDGRPKFIQKRIKPAGVAGIGPIGCNRSVFDSAQVTAVLILDDEVIVLHRYRAFFSFNVVNSFPDSSRPS